MEKKMETTIVYRSYIGIMEEKMETTIVYRGYIGIMEKMETTIVYRGVWNEGILEYPIMLILVTLTRTSVCAFSLPKTSKSKEVCFKPA